MSSDIRATHAVSLRSPDTTDCIFREVHLARYENNKYQLRFITQWANEEEPVITTINITEVGLDLVVDAATRLLLDRENYKHPPIGAENE